MSSLPKIPCLILVACLLICYSAQQAGAVDDPFTGAVEVFRFSFENDQDLDYDLQPDDWTRRIGREFPHYLQVEIDRHQGLHGQHSLEFQSNGGPAILYSPVQKVDAMHAYVFQGFIKTRMLKHDAAVISLSFLNHKRQRIQRFLTRPISGTHQDWQQVRIGPISPLPDVRFVVVGCHLLNGESADIKGSTWFDDLWLGKLPQLDLVSNFRTQFVAPGSPIKIETRISGLDALPPVVYPAFPLHGSGMLAALPVQPTYRLYLQLVDSQGKILDRYSVELPVLGNQKPSPTDDSNKPHTVNWELQPQVYGIYRVNASLLRDDVAIFQKQATFAVLDLVDQRLDGEFGWCFPRGTGDLPLKDLVEVSLQGGINWLKYPVWSSVHTGNGDRSAAISQFFDLLRLRRVKPVGLLNDPPVAVRQKFASNWTGISEIFTQAPKFWSGSIDPVLAKYASTVQHWQLGDDRDGSFVGIQELPKTLSTIKRQFDQIGRDTRIGVHWNSETPMPTDQGLSRAFFSVGQPQGQQAVPMKPNQAPTTYSRWLLLKPLPKSKYTPEERGADLVKRMVAAKMANADAIFARDVLDKEHGLLNPDGSPTLLFLPWRNTALALQGATYLGSLQLPGGSRNFLFERDDRDDVVMFIWNDQPTTETIYLGEQTDVTAINLWGEQTRLATQANTGRQVLSVGPKPLVIRGCSKPIARWRLALQFEMGRLPSATGVHREKILGRNPFGQGVTGKITLNAPSEWEVEPRSFSLQAGKNEDFQYPFLITLPANTTLGAEQMAIDLEIDADRKYQIRVYRQIQVGLGDVELAVTDRRLENGFLEIEQTLINKTSPIESLDFECSLFIPGAKRQKKLITRQGSGKSVKLYYAPNADELKGQELWLRAEQTNGRRVLNYRWTIGKDWDQ